MEKIGRNDPCPCGSQKKYKKCHGDDTTPTPAREVKRMIDMDHRLIGLLADFGAKHFAAKGWDPFYLEPPHEAHVHDETCDHEVMFADVSLPLALFQQPVEGLTVAEHFLAAKGKYVGADDKRWLETQRSSVFSVYQLVGVGESGSVTLRDRFSDEELTLVDEDLAQHGEKNEVFLGRVVGGVLTAMHPQMVQPDSAEDVVARVKEKASRAGDFESQNKLFAEWNDAVYEEEEDSDDASQHEDDAAP